MPICDHRHPIIQHIYQMFFLRKVGGAYDFLSSFYVLLRRLQFGNNVFIILR